MLSPRPKPLEPLIVVVTALLGFAALAGGGIVIDTRSACAADDAAPASSPARAATAAEKNAAGIDHAFVAGFDRFYAAAEKSNGVAGGMLLLGELNCTSCHAAEAAAAMRIDAKQAPLLGEVAARANPRYLRRFILDVHGAKPGTTMPNLLAGLAPSLAQATAEAITHYLASIATAPWRATGPDMSAIARGEALYHKVGCVACHAPVREAQSHPAANQNNASGAFAEESDEAQPPLDLELTSTPLGPNLHEKYSIAGLAQFLHDPLAVRPSGRMPRLNLTPAEAIDIASFLCRDTKAASNLRVAYYEGDWTRMPDLDRLAPKSTGGTTSFALGPLAERSNYAVRYDGFLRIAAAGEYTFHLHSDDGSRMYLDGKLLIDHDGIHGGETKTGTAQLDSGLHAIRVEFFQAQGGAELQVAYEGPGVRRQRIPATVLTAAEKPAPGEEPLVVDAALAAKGREAFVSVGCASCHQLTGSPSEIVHKLAAPPLAEVRTSAGCLSASPAKSRPHYYLNAAQRRALAAAITAIQQGALAPRNAKDQIAATMTAFNCYACHQRDDTGGVVREREMYFTANSPDLGDEGRIPPLLTGVGDKLRAAWLHAVLTESAVARPYMDTRMPQFGEYNLGNLADLFSDTDQTSHVASAVSDSPAEAKKAGFALVGKDGLSCISCHMFNRQKSLGIQAMDLAHMHERLRPEWFHQYMLDPPSFRPGTRMPQAFLNNKSAKQDIFDGDADRQINALWQYLADGRRAKQPEGLVPEGMEIIVGGEAVVYRAFIEGVGTRGIAVGYPEEVNLAFDANAMRPAMIWQGRFIDASRHWSGRGDGFQPPAGDDVRKLVQGAPLALLADERQSWPSATGKPAGYRFRGYRLDEVRRPTFLYDFGDIRVEDFFTGRGLASERHLVRTMRFTADEPGTAPANLYLRAAAQNAAIGPATDGAYRLEENLSLRFPAASSKRPLTRQSGGKHELLVPIKFADGKSEIVIEYRW